ncbi:glycoside hydrolase family 3 N-terminal domain-containing protein [Catellatospora sp. KI3]|uniref:glycoside hydrolase family 3 N-terminal domain-containing protein n=1 Tax=Catellatospora sp. KI3 TaxID=3041620 RepID=UPI002482B493|nr:glycoside hydrolase family 3 N-terminal domain-containing protein [Catellatospora sp. KI3]MDI1463888.1 glycoside hydrolase family 3 N-terminal domain-containing protein [Catellatospora sp. KI3]
MTGGRITRRTLLTAAGAGAVVAGLGGCAADGSHTAATPAPTGAPPSTATPGTPTGVTPSPSDEAVLRKKIARMLIAGFRGATAGPDDWIMRAVTEQGLGGVILFDRDQLTGGSRNIDSPPQVTALISSLRAAAPHLIVSIDQEGGKIARLKPANGFPATASQAAIGARNSPKVTRQWAEGMARTLVDIGVDYNFTPVVDLAVNPDNPAIAQLDRAFSADPAVVAANAEIAIAAYRAAKVRTSVKHFPGLGSASGNTDFESVDVTDTWTPTELEPYQKLIKDRALDTVMVTHFHNRKLDPRLPMSLSHAVVTGLLREQLGWDGLVVSDDMQATAITDAYGRDEAVALALAAGVDQLVFGNQAVYDPDIVEGVVGTVLGLVRAGKVTEAQLDRSVARIDALWPPT